MERAGWWREEEKGKKEKTNVEERWEQEEDVKEKKEGDTGKSKVRRGEEGREKKKKGEWSAPAISGVTSEH